MLGAALMGIGALAEAYWGVNAERQSLESIAAPLQSEETRTSRRRVAS
jgi:hypothetical protein